MRNKGFAITGIIYAMFLLFIVILIGNLSVELMMLKNNDNTNNRVEKTVKRFYTEVGVNPPVFNNTGLVPITRNASNTEWVVADQTTAWYDYSNKKWANAVALKTSGTAKPRSYYQANPGAVIDETDVLAYLVWIPRYKYAIPALKEDGSAYAATDAREIAIMFESGVETTGTSTVSPVNNKLSILKNAPQDSDYITHPAFTFGTQSLTGFWIAKFESTNTIGSTTVKPGLSAISTGQIKNFFDASVNSKTNWSLNTGETTMLKNNEWGAVAYLATSQYGKLTPITVNSYAGTSYAGYTGGGNNNTAYVTNVGQSTTGNVYGVYDMAGGIREVVMGWYGPGYAGSNFGYSLCPDIYGGDPFPCDYTGFTSDPGNKYYNLYTTHNTLTQICGATNCYGQAMQETAGWNANASYFSQTDIQPWVTRGNFGSTTWAGADIFSFHVIDGTGSHGFRITYKP